MFINIVPEVQIATANRTVNLSVNAEGGIVLTALALLIFFLICIVLAVYSRGDGQYFSLDYPFNLVALFMGQLVIVLTTLTVPVHASLYCAYRVSILFVVGIVMTIVGNKKFFMVPENWHLHVPLGFHHPDMSFIIWVITIPLVLLELIECMGALKSDVDIEVALAKGVGLAQKLIQASIYHFSLRHKVPAAGMSMGASWYLKVLSLFNFAMWLDSIMTEHEATRYVVGVFGNGFSIISSALDALLIDYRLLCCLLFAEHALEISSGEHDLDGGGYNIVEEAPTAEKQNSAFNAEITQMAGYGYVFGFLLFASQLVCAVQYAGLVPSWTNVFPIIAEILVIVLGIGLLCQPGVVEAESFGAWRETNAKTVDVMVAIIGTVGFTYWVLKSTFSSIWAVRHIPVKHNESDYLIWSATKNSVRSMGILFQLYLFGKIGPFFGCSEVIRRNKTNHFIMPALMLSLLSVFVTSIVDGYSGFIEGLLSKSNLHSVLYAFAKAGAPIHLGFALHMFLHFFIINNNMRSRRRLLPKMTQHRHARARLRPATAPPAQYEPLSQPLIDNAVSG